MEVKYFLTVPQMWSSAACYTMLEATKLAKIPSPELLYEPQCGAAFYFELLKENKRSLQINDEFIVVDIGGGLPISPPTRLCQAHRLVLRPRSSGSQILQVCLNLRKLLMATS